MKLATTTGDLGKYFVNESTAAPLEAMAQSRFKHFDMSFYKILYENSPWTGLKIWFSI